MLDVMSEPKKGARRTPAVVPPKEKDRPPAMYFRLDDATNAAIAAFIKSQRVPPTQPAVGLQALHEFLQREGFWPPKKS